MIKGTIHKGKRENWWEGEEREEEADEARIKYWSRSVFDQIKYYQESNTDRSYKHKLKKEECIMDYRLSVIGAHISQTH